MKRVLLFAALALTACDPVEVVVATIPPEPDGGRPPPRKPCAQNGDCPPDAFCEKPDCAAPLGKCSPRPLFCAGEVAPVCGCNGINYWNDCLRRDKGIAASTAGECVSAATCSSSGDCPDTDASCARLLPEASSCGGAPQGSCWVLPPTCPSGLDSVWGPCAGGACVDGCAAIRSGLSHSKLQTCP